MLTWTAPVGSALVSDRVRCEVGDFDDGLPDALPVRPGGHQVGLDPAVVVVDDQADVAGGDVGGAGQVPALLERDVQEQERSEQEQAQDAQGARAAGERGRGPRFGGTCVVFMAGVLSVSTRTGARPGT